jgi:hypothetical protein
MPKTPPSADDDPLKPLIEDPVVREAAHALFKGDRERVEMLLNGKDRRRRPDTPIEKWLLAHAVEKDQPDTNTAYQHTGNIDDEAIPPIDSETRSAKLLNEVKHARGAQAYQRMAADILKRRAEIAKLMKEPPGWQGWLIRRRRNIIRFSAILAGFAVGILMFALVIAPPPDPAIAALATSSALEAQAAGTRAAILALTPTVTPSVTPFSGVVQSGMNQGISLTIVNCGFGDILEVIQGSRPVPTPIVGANFSYFFIQYSATCRDTTDNVCSINNDLDFALRLNNSSFVPDTGLRVAGENSPDFLANGQTELGWLAFNVPRGVAPQSLLLIRPSSGGFGGTPTPTPVPVGMPLPCAVTDF